MTLNFLETALGTNLLKSFGKRRGSIVILMCFCGTISAFTSLNANAGKSDNIKFGGEWEISNRRQADLNELGIEFENWLDPEKEGKGKQYFIHGLREEGFSLDKYNALKKYEDKAKAKISASKNALQKAYLDCQEKRFENCDEPIMKLKPFLESEPYKSYELPKVFFQGRELKIDRPVSEAFDRLVSDLCNEQPTLVDKAAATHLLNNLNEKAKLSALEKRPHPQVILDQGLAIKTWADTIKARFPNLKEPPFIPRDIQGLLVFPKSKDGVPAVVAVSLDGGVVEMQIAPMTVSEFEENAHIIDEHLFKPARDLGFSVSPELQGHLHIDLLSAFPRSDGEIDANKVRRFVKDIEDHPDTFKNVMPDSYGNAQFLSETESKLRDDIRTILELPSDPTPGGKVKTSCVALDANRLQDDYHYLVKSIKDIYERYYYKLPKYRAVNFHASERTLEIRRLPSHLSVEKGYLPTIKAIKKRIEQIETNSEHSGSDPYSGIPQQQVNP